MKATIIKHKGLHEDVLNSYIELFNIWGFSFVESIKECDLCFFIGGGPLSSVFYGEEPNVDNARESKIQNYNDYDKYAAMLYKHMHNTYPEKLLVGLNRGALLLAALSGSKIVAHVENNWDCNHWVWFKEKGQSHLLPSKHVQVMDPYSLNIKSFEVIADKVNSKNIGLNEVGEQIRLIAEPECIFFKNTNCLCIQPSLIDIEKKEKDKGLKLFKNIILDYA